MTNTKKIRIGILGGSFNPPHAGHLLISELALKNLNLQQVWWVPTLQNPLKSDDIKGSFEQRVKLCEEITKDDPKIKIKDLEYRFFRNAKKFYTYNLLKRLNEKFKDHEFCLILGADSLVNLHKWHKYKQLDTLAEIAVFNRPGYRQKALNSIAAKNIHFSFYDGKTVDISSTEIRKK